jgi:hypothetical protein
LNTTESVDDDLKKDITKSVLESILNDEDEDTNPATGTQESNASEFECAETLPSNENIFPDKIHHDVDHQRKIMMKNDSKTKECENIDSPITERNLYDSIQVNDNAQSEKDLNGESLKDEDTPPDSENNQQDANNCNKNNSAESYQTDLDEKTIDDDNQVNKQKDLNTNQIYGIKYRNKPTTSHNTRSRSRVNKSIRHH